MASIQWKGSLGPSDVVCCGAFIIDKNFQSNPLMISECPYGILTDFPSKSDLKTCLHLNSSISNSNQYVAASKALLLAADLSTHQVKIWWI